MNDCRKNIIIHFLSQNFNLRCFRSAWTPKNTHLSSGKFLSTKTCYPESFSFFCLCPATPGLLINKIMFRPISRCLEAFLGFLVETKRKAYTKVTVVMCCQIFDRRSVAPSRGNFRRRPSPL